MRENVIEKYLRTESIARGYLCYKFVSPMQNGVPDRVLIGHGKTFFVELKAPGQEPRKLQKVIIERIRDHGGTVYVIDSKEGVDVLFAELE